MPSSLPLSVLLTHALIALTRDYDRAGTGDQPVPSLVVWSNILRAIGDHGVDQRVLPSLVSVSTRAIRVTVRSLEQQAWVVVEPQRGAKGKQVIRLTAQGHTAREAGRPLLDLVEKRWIRRFGDGRIGGLRVSLQTLVAQLDLELPHYPTGYGQGDDSVTGGSYFPEDAGPPRIPAHGQDWPVVLRGEQDAVSALPLSALLSQALVAFTIDYESEGLGPLAAAANVLRFIGDEGVPLGDVPASGGVSGTGRSGLERHRIVVVEPGSRANRSRLVHLTARGRRMRDAYEPLLVEIEQRWPSQYGIRVIDDLRVSLETLAGEFDDGGLPHYPMVTAWLQRRKQN